jgi:hypothetical protein
MKTWNNENARLKVEQLCALPDEARKEEANLINSDLKGWAKRNFQFSTRQQECMNLLPDSYYDETGFLLARAVDKKHPIDIIVSDDSTPPALRKRGDSVEGGWSEKDGFNVKYKFEF